MEEAAFDIVLKIVTNVVQFNGSRSEQFIDQERLYIRVGEMMQDTNPCNITEILTSELILFTLSKLKGTDLSDADEFQLSNEADILNSVNYSALIPENGESVSEASGTSILSDTVGQLAKRRGGMGQLFKTASDQTPEQEELYQPNKVDIRKAMQTGAIPKRRDKSSRNLVSPSKLNTMQLQQQQQKNESYPKKKIKYQSTNSLEDSTDENSNVTSYVHSSEKTDMSKSTDMSSFQKVNVSDLVTASNSSTSSYYTLSSAPDSLECIPDICDEVAPDHKQLSALEECRSTVKISRSSSHEAKEKTDKDVLKTTSFKMAEISEQIANNSDYAKTMLEKIGNLDIDNTAEENDMDGIASKTVEKPVTMGANNDQVNVIAYDVDITTDGAEVVEKKIETKLHKIAEVEKNVYVMNSKAEINVSGLNIMQDQPTCLDDNSENFPNLDLSISSNTSDKSRTCSPVANVSDKENVHLYSLEYDFCNEYPSHSESVKNRGENRSEDMNANYDHLKADSRNKKHTVKDSSLHSAGDSKLPSVTAEQSARKSSAVYDIFKTSGAVLEEKRRQDIWRVSHCSALFDLFPDVHTDYLSDRCNEVCYSENRFAALLNELVQNPNKPLKGEDYELSQINDVFSTAAHEAEEFDIFKVKVDGTPYVQLLMDDEQAARVPSPSVTQVECGCCYDSYPVEEICTCDGDPVHLFCCTCIRRYANEQIGQSRLVFKCLTADCTAGFSHSTLLNVLDAPVFKNLLVKQQAEEITAANIDDLETCPFCTFAVIFADKVTVKSDIKVLRCDNPDCGKLSCRLCKKADHSPTKCEEKQSQTNARTHLENEMTEAMVRECPKCHKRFLKESGCNKMTCQCGTSMCYICKQVIVNYSHFDRGGTPQLCPLWTADLEGLHAKEVAQRAQQIKSTVDPNLLLYDPTEQ